MRKVFSIILYIMLLIFIFLFIVEYKLSYIETHESFAHKNKIWAHRGYLIENENYTQNNLIEAVDDQIEGVELDLFFDFKCKRLIVAHDLPIKDTIVLEDYINLVGNKLYYWFDLKNLDENNVNLVIKNLKHLNDKYNLENNFFVESKRAYPLHKIHKQGIKTCLWLSTPSRNNLFKYYYFNLKNKLTLFFYKYNYISMPYYVYKRSDYNNFYHFPTCTWVGKDDFKNDSTTIINDKNLKIVLKDRIKVN